MHKKIFIAIDGPSASGKGTIARLLGEELNLPVLYTGNIYRAIAYKILQNNIDPHNLTEVTAVARKLKLEDLEITSLFQEKVGQYASIIGVHPEVRDITYLFQRDFIEKSEGAIIEGRDIGTVICPEANFKFYITADVEVRAKRRFAQQRESDYQTILADLKVRDERDQSRIVAPLKPAKDAIIIDSSKLDVQTTLDLLLRVIS